MSKSGFNTHNQMYNSIYQRDIPKGKLERSNIESNLAFIYEKLGSLRGKKVLEIGCGLGTLTNHFHKKKINIVGVDPSQYAIKYGRSKFGKRICLKVMAGEELNFRKNSFDVALSFDVIEHIPDLNLHLEEVKRVLSKGGVYAFQTPNKLINVFWETFKNRGFGWRTIHVNLQTYWSLKRIFRQNGFDIKIYRQPIATEFVRTKLNQVFGRHISSFLIWMISSRLIPLWLYPNFYAIAKPEMTNQPGK